jgi:uncharacterized membrane protein (DUF2068 family)
MKTHPVARARTLHAIAMMEAVKGIAVLAASVGVLSLVHHDLRHLAHEMVRHLGMNPDAHYPLILLHYVDVLENANLRSLVLIAMGYAILRLSEAYGLWNDLAWGEWLGALSGGIYIPFEISHFIGKPSLIGGVVFVINAFIVGFLAFRLYRRRRSAISVPQ